MLICDHSARFAFVETILLKAQDNTNTEASRSRRDGASIASTCKGSPTKIGLATEIGNGDCDKGESTRASDEKVRKDLFVIADAVHVSRLSFPASSSAEFDR